jgi:hypothetical protein
MNRRMDDYIDEAFGYIVCMPSKNGGDSAQKTGLNRFLKFLKVNSDKEQLARESAKFEQELDGLEDPNRPNYYRRHPDPSQWWSRSNNFTRDQQRSIVMACGALKLKKRLFGLLWAHIKRFGFYQNNRHPDPKRNEVLPNWLVRLVPKWEGWKFPDFAAPNHWGEYIRAIYMLGGLYKSIAVLWPILLICDLFGTIAVLLAQREWDNPNEADDDNMIVSILQARVALPTPVSFFNRRYYIKNRPLAGFLDPEHDQRNIPLRSAPGNRDMTGPESALWWKHHPINEGPPYYEYYVDVLKKYLRN